MTTCPVPDCTAVIGPRNTTGVCRPHKHKRDLCRCALCRRKRGEDVPQRGKQPPPREMNSRNERQPRPITLTRAPWEAGA